MNKNVITVLILFSTMIINRFFGLEIEYRIGICLAGMIGIFLVNREKFLQPQIRNRFFVLFSITILISLIFYQFS